MLTTCKQNLVALNLFLTILLQYFNLALQVDFMAGQWGHHITGDPETSRRPVLLVPPGQRDNPTSQWRAREISHGMYDRALGSFSPRLEKIFMY